MTSSRARAGRLVAIEGIDGAGKSTLQRALARALRRRGYRVRLRREPIDATLGRLAQQASVGDPWTGAVYFTVDRHLAASRLRGDLRRFDVVLTDRSFYSTLAYQGSRLPREERRRIEELQRQATVTPDQVLLLDLPSSWMTRRLDRRAKARGPLERTRRLGGVARAYRALARAHRWIVLDARRPPRELVATALAALGPRLGLPRRRAGGKTLRARTGPRGAR